MLKGLIRGRQENRIANRQKEFLKSAHSEDRGIQVEGSKISSYAYLGRSMSMENDLKEELNRKMRTAWSARIREAAYLLTDQSPCPSVQLDSSSSALLPSGDVDRHRCHV
ncbi:hypothetical protein RB195_024679 [Necator americanus]|uniref:Uncharacterized protein n=1 Tax=Necator americanus TaxID=51031 RepID=A0ABR1EPH3_NECAM